MKNLLLLLLLTLLFGCNADDGPAPFSLEGETYIVVAYEVEESMDLNGDGIFSTDLITENNSEASLVPFGKRMQFLNDGRAYYPLNDYPIFGVVGEEQVTSHGAPAAEPASYVFNRPNIRFSLGDSIASNTILSDDNQIIVTHFKPTELFSFNDNFDWRYFNESGEIETYTGDFIITLELQD